MTCVTFLRINILNRNLQYLSYICIALYHMQKKVNSSKPKYFYKQFPRIFRTALVHVYIFHGNWRVTLTPCVNQSWRLWHLPTVFGHCKLICAWDFPPDVNEFLLYKYMKTYCNHVLFCMLILIYEGHIVNQLFCLICKLIEINILLCFYDEPEASLEPHLW